MTNENATMSTEERLKVLREGADALLHELETPGPKMWLLEAIMARMTSAVKPARKRRGASKPAGKTAGK